MGEITLRWGIQRTSSAMRTPLFLILVLCIWAVSGCTPKGSVVTVGIVQIADDPVLDRARAGVMRALADSGFTEGQNIKVIYQNAQGDLSMVTTILQGFQSRGVDLILTNGTPCMTAAAHSVKQTPVVFTVSFSPEQVGIQLAPNNLWGVYDPFHADLFANLITECIPGIKRIGLPYNNAEPNAEYAAKRMKAEFALRGIEVVTASVTSVNDILMVGQYLAGEKVEAMVVAADNTIFLGLNALAREADKYKIPIFVGDPLQTEKGAAVGYGANYDTWGYESGLKAVDILKGRASGKSGKSAISPIEAYNIIINHPAAKRQGLILPESLLARAHQHLR